MDLHRLHTLLHDVRNGIGGVQNKLTLALISENISQELYNECLKSINYSLNKLVELGESFKLETKPIMWVNVFDLLAIIADETSITTSNITHSIKTDLEVAVIEKDFRSVIEEIIRNGLKHGANCFNIHLSCQNSVLKIFIKDNGSGLDQKTLDNMGVGSKGDGTRIVQQLMLNMQGKIKWFSNGNETIAIISLETNHDITK